MAESFIQLRVSKNGGYTWSDWKSRSLGDTGDFITPAIWRRLGTSRHFVFDIRTDTPCDLIASSLLGYSGQWEAAPVVGGAYADNSRPWSFQDTVNWIPVRIERPNGRSDWKLKGAPGYRLFATVGTGPIRGARDVEGKLFVVSGTGLYRVNRDTTSTLLGTIPGEGRVSLTHNQEGGGGKVVIANGTQAYTYDTVTGDFAIIDDEGFPGALTVEYLDQYILGIEPQRRFAFHSELADARSYDTTDRFESESSPDRLLGQLVDHGQWWLFGERTIDVYANTGAATGTFQRIGGSTIDRGLAGTYALAKLDNTVWWVADDGSVYRANGYTPERVSTHPIEQALRICDLSQAFCTVYEDEGHKILYITCPDGQTFGFDVASQEWHRRQSFDLLRWNIATLTKWLGVWIAGDYETGNLYQVDWGFKTEAGSPLICQRTTGVLHGNEEKVTVNGLRLLVDSGRTEQEPRGPGAIVDPLVIFNPLPVTYEGVPVIHSYRSAGGVRPHTFSIAAGSLPTGLSMNSEGLVTGTPTTEGAFAWIARVTDSRGFTADLPQGISAGPPVIDGGGVYIVAIAPPSLMTQSKAYEGARASLTLAAATTGIEGSHNRRAVSPSGLYVASSNNAATGPNRFRLRKYNGITGLWGAVPGADDLPTIGPNAMAWSPDSRFLAVTQSTLVANDRVIIYERIGDTLTQLSAPAVPPETSCLSVVWDSVGQRIALRHGNSNKTVLVYDFLPISGTLVNGRYVNDASGAVGFALAFLPGAGSRYLISGGSASQNTLQVIRLSDMAITNTVAVDCSVTAGWDTSGSYIITAGVDSPNFLQVWNFDGSVIGSETLVFSSNFANQPASCAIASLSSNGRHLAMVESASQTPFIYDCGGALPPVPTKLTNPAANGVNLSYIEWTGINI